MPDRQLLQEFTTDFDDEPLRIYRTDSRYELEWRGQTVSTRSEQIGRIIVALAERGTATDVAELGAAVYGDDYQPGNFDNPLRKARALLAKLGGRHTIVTPAGEYRLTVSPDFNVPGDPPTVGDGASMTITRGGVVENLRNAPLQYLFLAHYLPVAHTNPDGEAIARRAFGRDVTNTQLVRLQTNVNRVLENVGFVGRVTGLPQGSIELVGADPSSEPVFDPLSMTSMSAGDLPQLVQWLADNDLLTAPARKQTLSATTQLLPARLGDGWEGRGLDIAVVGSLFDFARSDEQVGEFSASSLKAYRQRLRTLLNEATTLFPELVPPAHNPAVERFVEPTLRDVIRRSVRESAGQPAAQRQTALQNARADVAAVARAADIALDARLNSDARAALPSGVVGEPATNVLASLEAVVAERREAIAAATPQPDAAPQPPPARPAADTPREFDPLSTDALTRADLTLLAAWAVERSLLSAGSAKAYVEAGASYAAAIARDTEADAVLDAQLVSRLLAGTGEADPPTGVSLTVHESYRPRLRRLLALATTYFPERMPGTEATATEFSRVDPTLRSVIRQSFAADGRTMAERVAALEAAGRAVDSTIISVAGAALDSPMNPSVEAAVLASPNVVDRVKEQLHPIFEERRIDREARQARTLARPVSLSSAEARRRLEAAWDARHVFDPASADAFTGKDLPALALWLMRNGLVADSRASTALIESPQPYLTSVLGETWADVEVARTHASRLTIMAADTSGSDFDNPPSRRTRLLFGGLMQDAATFFPDRFPEVDTGSARRRTDAPTLRDALRSSFAASSALPPAQRLDDLLAFRRAVEVAAAAGATNLDAPLDETAQQALFGGDTVPAEVAALIAPQLDAVRAERRAAAVTAPTRRRSSGQTRSGRATTPAPVAPAADEPELMTRRVLATMWIPAMSGGRIRFELVEDGDALYISADDLDVTVRSWERATFEALFESGGALPADRLRSLTRVVPTQHEMFVRNAIETPLSDLDHSIHVHYSSAVGVVAVSLSRFGLDGFRFRSEDSSVLIDDQWHSIDPLAYALLGQIAAGERNWNSIVSHAFGDISRDAAVPLLDYVVNAANGVLREMKVARRIPDPTVGDRPAEVYVDMSWAPPALEQSNDPDRDDRRDDPEDPGRGGVLGPGNGPEPDQLPTGGGSAADPRPSADERTDQSQSEVRGEAAMPAGPSEGLPEGGSPSGSSVRIAPGAVPRAVREPAVQATGLVTAAWHVHRAASRAFGEQQDVLPAPTRLPVESVRANYVSAAGAIEGEPVAVTAAARAVVDLGLALDQAEETATQARTLEGEPRDRFARALGADDDSRVAAEALGLGADFPEVGTHDDMRVLTVDLLGRNQTEFEAVGGAVERLHTEFAERAEVEAARQEAAVPATKAAIRGAYDTYPTVREAIDEAPDELVAKIATTKGGRPEPVLEGRSFADGAARELSRPSLIEVARRVHGGSTSEDKGAVGVQHEIERTTVAHRLGDDATARESGVRAATANARLGPGAYPHREEADLAASVTSVNGRVTSGVLRFAQQQPEPKPLIAHPAFASYNQAQTRPTGDARALPAASADRPAALHGASPHQPGAAPTTSRRDTSAPDARPAAVPSWRPSAAPSTGPVRSLQPSAPSGRSPHAR